MAEANSKSEARLTQNKSDQEQHSTITDDISRAMLRRYIQSREKIEKDIEFIMAFTSIFTQYKECCGDNLLVDFFAIGHANELMHIKLLDIIEELDEFLSLDQAMRTVMEEDAGNA